MWRQLLIFAVLLAGLIAWDRTLSHQAAEQRASSARIRPLISAEEQFDRAVAAFGLETGDGRRMLYLYADGLWRCLHAHGAPARGRAVQAILPAILDAEGVVRTTDPAAAASYGFDSPEMLRLSVRGQYVLEDDDGDVMYSLDIGRATPEAGGSFVRPTGTNEIWAVNTNLRPLLEPDLESGLPPMLDPHLIPEDWPGVRAGLHRVVVEQIGEPTLTLMRRERDLTPEERAAGAPPFDWIVRAGSTDFPGDPMQIFSFMGFLTRVPFAGILNPSHEPTLGLDTPRATITVEASDGSRLQLLLGDRGPRGGVAAGNTFTRNFYELAPAVADLLTPEIDLLVNPELGNPWEDFIRR